MDAASASGPWTLAALHLIEENRGVVARELAEELELPKLDFKARVRKLKALGLTVSLPVGYELSELGQRYLDSLGAD
jgi:DNA-binding IclR family transcriptional regulator